jgi:DNA-binding CsgD family transcriptional regulator
MRREEEYNRYCGIFSFFMGLYYLARTHEIYHLIPNTLTVVRLEFFFIFLAIPALGIFTDLLCLGQIKRITKIYTAFFAVLAVTQLIFPHPYGSDALVVWQLAGIPSLLWIMVRTILITFAGEIKKGKTIGAALWDSYSGNLLIGASTFILSAVADIYNALFLHYSFSMSRYGLCVFVLALALMLARLYGKTVKELEEKSALLESADNPQASWEAVFDEHGLTDREKEISRLMVEGLSNAGIAEQTFLSPATINFHITRIYRKFNIAGKSGGRAAFLSRFLQQQG